MAAAVALPVVGAATPQPAAPGPAIALTFDDLPAHGPLPAGVTRLGVARAILDALRRHGVNSAFGFVAGSFGADDPTAPRVLQAWRAAGHPLGNHSFSHANLDASDPAAYTADISRNEAVVAPLMAGQDWHWFRYPFLAEGATPARRTRVRQFLADHGYKIASVTLNFNDWAYTEPFARCRAKRDDRGVRALERLYLAAAAADFERAGNLAAQADGHRIPYVLLLHAGAFTARMLPRLLALYEADGARFVSLVEAQADPFYVADTIPSSPGGPVTLEGAAAARGIAVPIAAGGDPSSVCR